MLREPWSGRQVQTKKMCALFKSTSATYHFMVIHSLITHYPSVEVQSTDLVHQNLQLLWSLNSAVAVLWLASDVKFHEDTLCQQVQKEHVHLSNYTGSTDLCTSLTACGITPNFCPFVSQSKMCPWWQCLKAVTGDFLQTCSVWSFARDLCFFISELSWTAPCNQCFSFCQINLNQQISGVTNILICIPKK